MIAHLHVHVNANNIHVQYSLLHLDYTCNVSVDTMIK